MEKCDKIESVATGKVSKIVKYTLEAECVNLRKNGLSYSQIADDLNSSAKVPNNDKIDKFVVARFLDKIPEITRNLIQREEKKRMLEVINTNFNVITEIATLFSKTKSLLELMEEDAVDNNKIVNPYMHKALVSEMRELLRQMAEIQKEVNDYTNIRKFMEIVLKVLQDEVPEKIPVIAEKLRITKGTQWFSEIIDKKESK